MLAFSNNRQKPETARESEINLAKVGVEGSNPFARSKVLPEKSERYDGAATRRPFAFTLTFLGQKKCKHYVSS